MKKIMTVVGARPQVIKEAVFCGAIQKRDDLEEVLVHTGQHYDRNMSGVFFDILHIREPDYNLEVGSGRHGEMTGKIMIAFEEVVLKESPDVVVVYGDTNSTAAAALVAAKLHIPIVHVEAGLRQLPKNMPEEINRVITDHMASTLFCPSELAVQNLKAEGIISGVHNTGDIMYDLFCTMKSHFSYSLLKKHELKENQYAVLTMHRDFNVDEPEKLKKALGQIDKIARELPLIFPIHPRTRAKIGQFGLESLLTHAITIEPVDYLQLMGLVSSSRFVITDSGGLQKEAYFAEKRSVVVMEDTSWRELTENGWNVLARGAEIYDRCQQVKDSRVSYTPLIYGEGNAADAMAEIISKLV